MFHFQHHQSSVGELHIGVHFDHARYGEGVGGGFSDGGRWGGWGSWYHDRWLLRWWLLLWLLLMLVLLLLDVVAGSTGGLWMWFLLVLLLLLILLLLLLLLMMMNIARIGTAGTGGGRFDLRRSGMRRRMVRQRLRRPRARPVHAVGRRRRVRGVTAARDARSGLLELLLLLLLMLMHLLLLLRMLQVYRWLLRRRRHVGRGLLRRTARVIAHRPWRERGMRVRRSALGHVGRSVEPSRQRIGVAGVTRLPTRRCRRFAHQRLSSIVLLGRRHRRGAAAVGDGLEPSVHEEGMIVRRRTIQTIRTITAAHASHADAAAGRSPPISHGREGGPAAASAEPSSPSSVPIPPRAAASGGRPPEPRRGTLPAELILLRGRRPRRFPAGMGVALQRRMKFPARRSPERIGILRHGEGIVVVVVGSHIASSSSLIHSSVHESSSIHSSSAAARGRHHAIVRHVVVGRIAVPIPSSSSSIDSAGGRHAPPSGRSVVRRHHSPRPWRSSSSRHAHAHALRGRTVIVAHHHGRRMRPSSLQRRRTAALHARLLPLRLRHVPQHGVAPHPDRIGVPSMIVRIVPIEAPPASVIHPSIIGRSSHGSSSSSHAAPTSSVGNVPPQIGIARHAIGHFGVRSPRGGRRTPSSARSAAAHASPPHRPSQRRVARHSSRAEGGRGSPPRGHVHVVDVSSSRGRSISRSS